MITYIYIYIHIYNIYIIYIIYIYIYICVYVCVYCYAGRDFLRFEIGALCVSSTHLNVLRGEVNLQCFKMLLKKESSSLDQIF